MCNLELINFIKTGSYAYKLTSKLILFRQYYITKYVVLYVIMY